MQLHFLIHTHVNSLKSDDAYTPVNIVIIDPDYCMLPFQHQAINWTNNDFQSIRHLERDFSSLNEITTLSVYENVVCKMSAILFRLQYVKLCQGYW